MRKLIFAIALVLSACTDPEKATKILTEQGFNNIYIVGYDFWGCSKDDFYRTGFTAEKDGNQIKGVVCSGILFKGSTLRFF